uniref:Uncharacterized protein n=1 Tax=viral metagenome TaxID=1070528 RepID=A0A6C0L7H2_9ZZZZ
MTSNYNIFVIQLENDKWFLHTSKESQIDRVLFESQVIYDFVRKNPPIKVYEISKSTHYFDINTLTKKYMNFIGIENVRGGIYSDEILPEFLLKSLELEINSTVEVYNKTSIFDSISNRENLTLDDYKKRAIEYNQLLSTGYKSITRDFFTNLEWLNNKVESYDYENQMHCADKFNKEETDRYKNLLSDMDTVRNYYYKLDEDKIKVDISVSLKYPGFTLDYFTYHQYWNKNLETEKVIALDILRKYKFMGYTLINIIDCMEFDFYNPNQ